MKASEYYYDVPPETWDNMLYFDALEDRAKRAKELYLKLSSEQDKYHKELPYEKRVRIQKVYEAWQFNTKLLEERERNM